MQAVMSVVKAHDLFFLDSLTSSKSIAYTTARSHGVRAAENNVFLDSDTEEKAVVEERLRRLVNIAQQNGHAIGIGHPKTWTYEAIRDSRDMLESAGVELVFVSDLAK